MSKSIMDQLANVPDEKKENTFKMLLMYKTRDMRYPFSAHFELTPLCTLNCKMCYVHLQKDEVEKNGKILSGDEWKKLIKDCDSVGLHSLTLTGGECTMHPDFKDIYECAYRSGMLVNMITNATLIDEEMAFFLKSMPPQRICITLYGFSQSTYEKACGNGAAFDKVINGILLLKKMGLNLLIQSTITEDMIQDVPLIAQFAKENNIEFVYSANIKANRNCDISTVDSCAVKTDEMTNLRKKLAEMEGKEYKEPPLLTEFPEKIKERGMLCGAAVNSFHINWKGEMAPCVTFDAFLTYPLRNGVKKAWEQMYEWANTVPQLIACQTCKYQLRCSRCITLHYGDTHEFGKVSPRLCYKIQHGITD